MHFQFDLSPIVPFSDGQSVTHVLVNSFAYEKYEELW